MEKFDQDKALAACKKASAILAGIEEKVFDWAQTKTKLPKNFERTLVSHRQVAGRLPDNWVGMAQAQYVVAQILGDPAVLARFIKMVRKEMSGDEVTFVESALEVPWRFSLFSLENHLGGDFYTIHDHFAGEELVLNSVSVTRLRHEGKQLFFTLLFPNPECWQSYGIVGFFRGMTPVDINQFASMVDVPLYEAQGSAAVALAHPVPFMLLYAYSEMPLVMHGKDSVRICCSEVALLDPGSVVLPESYDVEKSQPGKPEVLRLRLGGGNFFDHIDFYLDLENKQAFLTASNYQNYQTGVQLLAPYLSIPLEPQFDVGMLMYTTLMELLGIKPRVVWYESLFEQEPAPEQSAGNRKLNAALAQISKKLNHGEPIDTKALSAQFKVPQDLLEQLLSTVKDPDSAHPIDLEYSIPGYSAPPPAIRVKMRGSFSRNSLFSFNQGRSVKEHFSLTRTDRVNLLHTHTKAGTADLDDYPYILDDIYEDFWTTPDATIMNYTMYLLHQNGTTPYQARDYAAEVLRIFHQVLISDTEAATIQSFIRRYARFIHGMVVPAGLAVMDGLHELQDIRSGAFAIRETEFMRAWLRW